MTGRGGAGRGLVVAYSLYKIKPKLLTIGGGGGGGRRGEGERMGKKSTKD